METIGIGKRVLAHDLVDTFVASEGSINMYYGKIGNGKTYASTSDVIDLLREGKVCYVNWHINVQDFDDRESLFQSFWNWMFFRKRYYFIPCSDNLHYFDPDDFGTTQQMVEWLSNLNDCHIFFDEGQDMFDSYEGTRFAKSKRRLILHTRHYHRTLNIISQRPTAIQVSARGNVNRFYKCVKTGTWFGVPRFVRYEFQSMVNENVDENSEPESTKKYWGHASIFNAYNTDYLAEGIPKSQQVFFSAYDLTYKERLVVLLRNLRLLKKPAPPLPWYEQIPDKRGFPTGSVWQWDRGLQNNPPVWKLKVKHL